MLRQIRNKKIYLAMVFLIGVVALTAALLFRPIEKNDVDVEFQFMDETFKENELHVLISPFRQSKCGFDSLESFDGIHTFIVLFNHGKLQDYKDKGISQARDFFIYAKYQNQYVKLKYKNSLLLGDDKTEIKLSFDQKSMNGRVFKDKMAFSENHYDMQLLNNLDQL